MKRKISKPPSSQNGPKPGHSKLLQESSAAKPSDKLRREGEKSSGASGQDGPKAGTKAAKDSRKMDKSKFRVEKTGAKLDKARDMLAKQKPQKPPGVVMYLSRAAKYEVWAKVHGKIHEVERENVGVEAAHRTELMGEKAARTASRFIKHRNRTHPVRQVAKWERKHIKSSADLRFRQLARENPELNKGAVKRFMQKKQLRKQYQKQVKAVTNNTVIKTGETAFSATGKISRVAVNCIKRHPTGVVIALLIFLLIMILQSCVGGALIVGNGLMGAIGGTSYLSEDEDIDEAELRYTEWETDLLLQALNAEATHSGYDEYRYNIAATGHDSYAMLAYLTAKYDNFTFAEVRGELQYIFNQQYSLTFTRIVEVRSYTIHWTDEDGTRHSERIYYNYYILQTTLTARSFEDVIGPLLTTQDEQDRYEIYMFLHGNRQYVGSPFAFCWLPYVSSYYGYRVHPISGEKDYHAGVDIAVPTDTEIQAGGKGVVLESGYNGGYGLCLLVDYGKGITACYAHCSALLAGVGQTVELGDIIALSGNTGSSTGPHLHMECIKNGSYLNPLYYVDGTVNY